MDALLNAGNAGLDFAQRGFAILHEQDGAKAIDVWLSERKIFAVDKLGANFSLLFNLTMRWPRGIVSEIVAILDKEDEWAMASWFLFPNGWITRLENGIETAVSPSEAIDDEQTEEMSRAKSVTRPRCVGVTGRGLHFIKVQRTLSCNLNGRISEEEHNVCL